jgi:hypothetical protein
MGRRREQKSQVRVVEKPLPEKTEKKKPKKK